jgi:transmembrane sensor
MNHLYNKNLQDLLTNSSFVRWVKFPHKESEQKWQQWLEKNPQRKKDVAIARELILRMNFKTIHPDNDQIEDSYHATLDKINNLNSIKTKKSERGGFSIFKVAAAILFLFSSFSAIYLIVSNPETAVETIQTEVAEIIQRKNPAGTRSKITLPDGSYVWLNAESEISYPTVFTKDREVSLKGEAFFEVVKDTLKPFKVNTRLSQIKVLGTSFNVNAYRNDVHERVSLMEGKVTVSLLENDTSSLLLPGEQILINQKTGISENQQFDSLEVFGWTQGLLVFKNAGKNEIINKLSRWYGVKIEILKQPSSTWNVNGYFENQSLEMVLERLAFSKEFDYTIEDKNVIIKFK